MERSAFGVMYVDDGFFERVMILLYVFGEQSELGFWWMW